MDARLALHLDKQDIIDSILRYASGIDMRDWELYRSAFTDEVEVDFTSWGGGEVRRLSGDAWVAGVRSTLAGFDGTQHTLTNFVVEVRGDEATAVVYMSAQHYLPNDKGDSTLTIGGYYTHELVRCPSDWKIRRAKLTVTWTTGNRHIFELARARTAAGNEFPKRDR
ncbi:MAG: nuclear transport factor 2 family protein [Dehalococcoidia bacterium]